MKKIIAILLTLLVCATATAQITNSIVIDRNSFRAVQTDVLTGVNIDPIGMDSSRQPCARIKIKFDRMNKAQIDALEVKMRSNTDLTKQKVADYLTRQEQSCPRQSQSLKVLRPLSKTRKRSSRRRRMTTTMRLRTFRRMPTSSEGV